MVTPAMTFVRIISAHCILVPAAARGSTMEMISIGSVDLAKRIEASKPDD